ncbi:fimbrial protein [Salmonella enterica]|nr:fimbrial protein [Salmonella enterica]
MLFAAGVLVTGCALAQSQSIPPGHWQEGMFVGRTEFGGTLYVDNTWRWQPRSVLISASDAIQAGLTNGRRGMVRESRTGGDFYVLGGHTSSLITPRPGFQPSVTWLQVTPSSSRIAARGELARGQVRYGEITFRMRHVLAWQDGASADSGWRVVSGEVTPYGSLQVKRQLWQVAGYKWVPEYSGLMARPDAFVSGAEMLMSSGKKIPDVAGAWVTFLSDVRVNFPGAEEPIKRWQGSLTPVVVYF